MALNYSPYNPNAKYSPYVPPLNYTPYTPPPKQEKPYIRYAGSPHVYDKATGTRVTYEEAVAKNIWAQVDDVDTPDPHLAPPAQPTFPTPTAQTTPAVAPSVKAPTLPQPVVAPIKPTTPKPLVTPASEWKPLTQEALSKIPGPLDLTQPKDTPPLPPMDTSGIIGDVGARLSAAPKKPTEKEQSVERFEALSKTLDEKNRSGLIQKLEKDLDVVADNLNRIDIQIKMAKIKIDKGDESVIPFHNTLVEKWNKEIENYIPVYDEYSRNIDEYKERFVKEPEKKDLVIPEQQKGLLPITKTTSPSYLSEQERGQVATTGTLLDSVMALGKSLVQKEPRKDWADAIVAGVYDTSSAARNMIAIGLDKIGADQISDKLKKLAANDKETVKAFEALGLYISDAKTFAEATRDPRWIASNIGRSLPNMAFSMALAAPAVAFGAPAAIVGGLSFLGSFTLEGGFAYQEAKDLGADNSTAEKIAVIVGVANGILEALPITRLLTKNRGGGLIKKSIIGEITKGILMQTGLESGTEGLQEIVLNAVVKIFSLDENRKYLQGVPESMYVGALLGAGGEAVASIKGLTKGTELSAGLSIKNIGEGPTSPIDTTKKKTIAPIKPKVIEPTKVPTKIEPTKPTLPAIPQEVEAKKQAVVEKANVEAQLAKVTDTAMASIPEITPVKQATTPQAVARAKLVNAEVKVWAQLDSAEAGKRIFADTLDYGKDYNIFAKPSTFPAWIPEGLRTKSVVKQVSDAMAEGMRIDTGRAGELYSLAIQQVAKEAGLTRKEAASIMLARPSQHVVKIDIEKVRKAMAKTAETMKGRITEARMGLKPPPSPKVVTTEKAALKKKITEQAKGARYGYAAGKKEVRTKMLADFKTKTESRKAIKQELYEYAKKTMPVAIRGKAFSKLKNAQTELQLGRAIDFIDRQVETYSQRVLRSKIKGELKRGRPRKQAGVTTGIYTPEAYQQLSVIKEADVKSMNSSELSRLLSTIKSIKEKARIDRAAEKKAKDEQFAKNKKEMAIKSKPLGKELKPGWYAAPIKGTGFFDQKPVKGTVNRIVNWNLGLINLLDVLDKYDKTSDQYEGFWAKWAGDMVHKSSNAQIEGTIKQTTKVQEAIARIFGTTNKRKLRGIIGDMSTEKRFVGEFINLEGDKVSLKHTPGELIQKYAELKDPTLMATFRGGRTKTGEIFGMRWTPEMIEAVENSLTDQEKAWGDFLMDFYREYYPELNEAYRAEFHIDMPFNPFYVPLSRDIDSTVPTGELLAEDAKNYRASVKNKSLMARTGSKEKLAFRDANSVLMNHIIKMEHYKAWSNTISELRRMFGDKEVRATIGQFHGDSILKNIDSYINDLARGGVDPALVIKGVDKARARFTKAVLAGKPIIGLKQVPSVLAYMTEISVKDFVTGVQDFWKHPVENYRELIEKSPFLLDRFGKGHERDVRLATQKTPVKILSQTKNFLEFMMNNIRMPDRFAVMQGAWAVYKSGGKTKESMTRAEAITKRTQPTYGIETLAKGQRGGSLLQLATMFQNQPNKYFRITADNLRNLKHGRGSRAERIKAIMIAWVILPSLFQWVSDGFRWDPKRQFRAAVLGPLNHPLMLGNFMQSIYGWVTDKPYDHDISALLSIFDDLKYAVTKSVTVGEDIMDYGFSLVDTEDLIEAIEWWARFGFKAAGLPQYAIQVERAVRRGKPLELLLSEYSIGEREGEEKSPSEEIKEDILKGAGIKSPGEQAERMREQIRKKYGIER